jgi:hypothetical protein
MRRSYAKFSTAAMMALAADVAGPRVHDLQIGAAMAGKALSLGKHTGKCRRKCRSDTHVLVIHHSTNVGRFFPARHFARRRLLIRKAILPHPLAVRPRELD